MPGLAGIFNLQIEGWILAAIVRKLCAKELSAMKKKASLQHIGAIGLACWLAMMGSAAWGETIRLDQLNIGNTEQDWGQPHANQSVDGNPLNIGGTAFGHGLGTHANSSLSITVNGATRFSGSVGLDGEVASTEAGVEFLVLGDGKELWRSGVMRAKEAAKTFALELQGVKTLALRVAAAGDSIDFDHADWAEASFEFEGTAPAAAGADPEAAEILTPAAPASPRINGPSVVGARPGHPFFYHIPVTGEAPISVTAENLPAGLTLDAAPGKSRARSRKRGSIR